MGIVFVVIVAFLLYYFIPWYRRHRKLCKLLDEVPGPKPWPIIGNAHQLKLEANEFFELATNASVAYQNPGMVRGYLLWLPYLIVFGTEEAEAILSSTKHINKSREYRLLEPWLGKGLLTNNGDSWRNRRKNLTPTFHYDILKDFIEVFNRQSATLVECLQGKAGEGVFDAYYFVTRCALDIICETAMGVNIGAQHTVNLSYLDAIQEINDMVHERQKKPWMWWDPMFKLFGRSAEHEKCLNIIHGLREKVFKDKLAALKEEKRSESQQGKKRLAFLDLLLEMISANKLTLEEAKMEVDTFMFEGHDTTSVNISWTLYLLGNHPEIQEKVYQEICQHVSDEKFEMTSENLKELVYLEACIKESLRLYPSTPFIARQLEENCEIGKYTIPAGTDVIISTHSVHRDPKYWPDAEIFNPDRFLPENSLGRHPYAYLPFSAGSRNCIGQRFALMEAKTVVGHVVKNFRIKAGIKRHAMVPKAELLLRPTHGYMLLIEKR